MRSHPPEDGRLQTVRSGALRGAEPGLRRACRNMRASVPGFGTRPPDGACGRLSGYGGNRSKPADKKNIREWIPLV